jgi:threonine/homoserine/homoserine lactone efflux protein
MATNVVASLRPVAAEMTAKTAAPSSPGLSLTSCHVDMLSPDAYLAAVALTVVLCKVLVEEIDILAQIALVLLFTLLVCFLVAFPIVLLPEAFFACSAPVPRLL